MQSLDVEGKKFNFLTAIKLEGQDIRKNNVWKCLCDCGKYRNVSTHMLVKGLTKSCGCMNFKLPHGNRKTTPKDTSINSLWNRHLQTAKRKNREWSLTKVEFKNLVFSNCHYCGRAPAQNYNVFITNEGTYRKQTVKDWADSGNVVYNGIDRKDNDIGYTLENSLSCCFVCNRAKLTMSYQDFLNWIKDLVSYTK